MRKKRDFHFPIVIAFTSIATIYGGSAAATALPAPVATAAAAPSATPASQESPSASGATIWIGSSGAAEVGIALPLAAWPSLFRGLGQGELVALIGTDEAGIGLAHRFRDVALSVGKASVGAAIGIGGVLPYSSPCAASSAKDCRSGFRATRFVLTLTMPVSVNQEGKH